jgi:hypothetical protein
MVGLSVAVVLFGAPHGQAGAADISSTKSQLQALQEEVVASASRIASLTLVYEQDNTQAAALAQQVASDQTQVANLEQQASATGAALRNDALLSYTGSGMATASGGANAAAAEIGQEYLSVAAGDIQDTLDLYRTQEAQVTAAESQLKAELGASQAAARATEAARRSALSQAASVQGQLNSLQAQLAALEAAQAKANAAAAAAAVRTQGLPVNNGLVTVVASVVSAAPGGNAGGNWLRLRECESGNNYAENTGNGYYGAYQFSQQTWDNLGYPGRPDLESPAMQDAAAQKLQQEAGWGQWPACSAALGLS